MRDLGIDHFSDVDLLLKGGLLDWLLVHDVVEVVGGRDLGEH